MIRWTSTLAPMSMPRVGSSRISTRGFGRQPLGEHDLLLVAARQRADRLVDAGHPHARTARCSRVATRALRRPRHRKPREQPRQDRQGHVLGDREVEDEALLVAVLGEVGDAGAHRLGRAGERAPACPPSRTSPASRWSIPNRTRATSVRPAPTSPAMPDDLAGPHREADVLELAGARQALDLEEDVADRRSRPSGTASPSRPTMCRIRSAVVSSDVGVRDDVACRRAAPSPGRTGRTPRRGGG